MLEIMKGNKVLLEVEIMDPDRSNQLVNLSDVTQATFLVKSKKSNPNDSAFITKTTGASLGILLNTGKQVEDINPIPGIYVECYSSLAAASPYLAYNHTEATLQFGEGIPINIAVGNRFQVTNESNQTLTVWVNPNGLPSEDSTMPVQLHSSKGLAVIRIDPDDTKLLPAKVYYFGLQLTWSTFDIQEVNFGTDRIDIQQDIILQS